MFVANENENSCLLDEKNNQKFLANSGVCTYFGNVFLPVDGNKLPTIKYKLRKILVDYGLSKTCTEINQKLDFIKVWYIDPNSTELRGFLLQRYNDKQYKDSQAIEVSISLEGSLVVPPEVVREIKVYPGLTRLLFQEFIEEPKVRSMIDNNPYGEMKEIIHKGNLAPTVPLQAILAEGVD